MPGSGFSSNASLGFRSFRPSSLTLHAMYLAVYIICWTMILSVFSLGIPVMAWLARLPAMTRSAAAGVPDLRLGDEGHRVHHRARRGRRDSEASRESGGAVPPWTARCGNPPPPPPDPISAAAVSAECVHRGGGRSRSRGSERVVPGRALPNAGFYRIGDRLGHPSPSRASNRRLNPVPGWR